MIKTPWLLIVALTTILICQYSPKAVGLSLPNEGAIPQLPGIQFVLPSNEITVEVQDCFIEKFDELGDKHPKLRPWLLEFQRTASAVSIARHDCDTVSGGISEQCLVAWKRSAAAQVLRVSLALFEYKDFDGNPLEFLTNTLKEFQSCWD